MGKVINFQDIKKPLTDVSDPVIKLKAIRDNLISLNTAFDCLRGELDSFETHMNKVSRKLEDSKTIINNKK